MCHLRKGSPRKFGDTCAQNLCVKSGKRIFEIDFQTKNQNMEVGVIIRFLTQSLNHVTGVKQESGDKLRKSID